jgi:hypothetical protein
MSLLTILGIWSWVFVVIFTANAYRTNTGVGQTPRGAIIEAWTNIAIGFTVNFLANFALLPMVGATITAGENFALGWIYTAISIVRAYCVRRWFNVLQFVGTSTKS